jgi:hypothetical protein
MEEESFRTETEVNSKTAHQDTVAPTGTTMLAVPLRVIMLSYNHIVYSIKSGAYKDLNIDELKAVVDNAATLKVLIPEQLIKQLE